jgi:hypothetical protein
VTGGAIRRVVAGLAVALMAASAEADVVELANGERIEGKLLQVTEQMVVVGTANGIVSLTRRDVRSIALTPPPAPAAAPAVPAGEAVAALKELQTAVTAPLSPSEYRSHVTQSRLVVDPYLKQANGPAPVVEAVRDALAFYEFAGAVWESRLTNSASASAAIGRNAMIDRCPALQKIVAEYPPATDQETAWRRGVALEFEVPIIFRCASDKVADAERALKR